MVLGCGTSSLRVRPALTVSIDEIDRGMAALDRVLRASVCDGTPLRTWELRAAFAGADGRVYGREVPAYTTLVEVADRGERATCWPSTADSAQRLGSRSSG